MNLISIFVNHEALVSELLSVFGLLNSFLTESLANKHHFTKKLKLASFGLVFGRASASAPLRALLQLRTTTLSTSTTTN